MTFSGRFGLAALAAAALLWPGAGLCEGPAGKAGGEAGQSTRLGRALKVTNAVLMKEVEDIGQMGRISVKVLRVKDLGKGSTTVGLIIEKEGRAEYDMDFTNTLDSGEVLEVYNATKRLLVLLEQWEQTPPKQVTETAFSTRDGFVIGIYAGRGKTGEGFIRMGRDPKATFLDKAQIQELQAILWRAVQSIDAGQAGPPAKK
mgnify:FL=1